MSSPINNFVILNINVILKKIYVSVLSTKKGIS